MVNAAMAWPRSWHIRGAFEFRLIAKFR